ncbi:MAG TPA: methyl-accepting chemotaxis protein [Steroidobacteraceae bacterium]|nr:methyl-accepting chemotaxis protein [Steroidobacteraceae bacterium]
MSIRTSTVGFLGRLRLWQKLALLLAAMAVPAVLLGCFYLSRASADVQQARDEAAGVRYLQALGEVSNALLAHRDAAFAFLSGDKARSGDVASQTDEVDRRIAAVQSLDERLGKRFNVTDAWQGLKSQWDTIKAKTAQSSADDSDAADALLLGRIIQLTESVSAASSATVDPSLGTQGLLRTATEHTANALRAQSEIQQHAVRTAAKGYLGGDDRMAIQVSHDRLAGTLAVIGEVLDRPGNREESALQSAFGTARSGGEALQGLIQTKILGAQNLEVTPAEIYNAGVSANRALEQLSAAVYTQLLTSLDERASSLAWKRDTTAIATALAMTLALALSWLITRSLSTPLGHAIEVFGQIAVGRYDNEIRAAGTDEAGQVLSAIAEMQGKLRAQIETERKVAAENARIRQALDKASTSVVLANASDEVIYVNAAAQASFTRNQHEMRKSLPSLDAHRLQGSSLASLAADANHERRRLAGLSGSSAEDRELGACTFHVIASPVRSDKGERLGTVMEWTDRTQELAIEREMQAMLSAVVAGDLGKRIQMAGKSGFFEATSGGVNQLADNLAEVVAQVQSAAREIARGAREIMSGNSNLQMRSDEQSSSLAETASSMEEMTATVGQNAENAGQANQLALAAREQAEKGGAEVTKAVGAMSEINDSAKKIADIIGVIDEIAFQTNLLALNAAVEAARAGEQGRGFAVVASEVRSLAGRSATAAREIKELIQDSVKKVSDGSVLVAQSGQTLEQIVTSVKKVSDIVAEIAAASHEQSSGISQVNRAVAQMDDLTQQNASLVAQATDATKAMAAQAGDLNEMMERYQLGSSRSAPAELSSNGYNLSGAVPAEDAADVDGQFDHFRKVSEG